MKAKKWIILLIIIIVAILIWQYYGKPEISEEEGLPPTEEGEVTPVYSWEDKGEGVWVRTDTGCEDIIEYTCTSNCYEVIPVCPFDSNIVENTTTPEGTEVVCFNRGCTFNDCNIICPT
jgi:hypothetical protein